MQVISTRLESNYKLQLAVGGYPNVHHEKRYGFFVSYVHDMEISGLPGLSCTNNISFKFI